MMHSTQCYSLRKTLFKVRYFFSREARLIRKHKRLENDPESISAVLRHGHTHPFVVWHSPKQPGGDWNITGNISIPTNDIAKLGDLSKLEEYSPIRLL